MTELNNIAQSNYDRFISATGSPATREVTEVEIGNPYDRATRVFLIGHQSNPLYRTYLERTWMWLEPKETQRVSVMFEYALDPALDRLPPDLAGLNSEQVQSGRRMPNNVGLLAYIEDPYDDPRHCLLPLGGAQAQIATGRGTRFERLATDGGQVNGFVVTFDGDPVANGLVLVRADLEHGNPTGFAYVQASVVDGEFAAQIPRRAVGIRAYYTGTANYAPCESDLRS